MTCDHICDQHPDRYECPDALIAVVRGGFGLIVHDDGHSDHRYRLLPWCGTSLPPISGIQTAQSEG